MEKYCFPNKCFYYTEIKLSDNSITPWCNYTCTPCKGRFEKCEKFIDESEHYLHEIVIQSKKMDELVKNIEEKIIKENKNGNS